MPKPKHRFKEADIEELCVLLYGDAELWKTMVKLSPTLRIVTRRQAIRVLSWLERRNDPAREFL